MDFLGLCCGFGGVFMAVNLNDRPWPKGLPWLIWLILLTILASLLALGGFLGDGQFLF
ncbi:MAG TPA: hypothetical protein VG077_07075 [Verrucomicrobiae bacterium]|nr:hypothetical protein [Verrucomicrobiae bacterium]